MNIYTIIGLFAAICTTAAYMPQAFKIIKTRDTKAISLSMYVVMTTGTLSWFIYGVLIGDVPLMLANGITSIFTIAILVMKIRYR